MLISDPVYGTEEIAEPWLLDLMGSQAMGRLKGVLQHGISGLVGITTPVTRYDHSVGAMILIRRLGGSVEEQAAALLHDVSHTAFSHVIDYVVDGHDSQSYHDEVKEEYVSGTDLPAIIGKYHHDWRTLIDEQRYSLLEQPAPALCADRIDYFLRDALDLGIATAGAVRKVLSHLLNVEGRIVVDDAGAASWLAYTYIIADKASWANFREVGLYEITARAIKRALKLGVISEAEFWSTDAAVWETMHSSSDPELRRQLALVSPDTRFISDPEQPDFRISTKLRTIDPDVMIDGRLRKLSEINDLFNDYRLRYLRQKRGKWPVRIVASIPLE